MPGDSDQNKKEPAPEPEVSATGEARVGDSNTLVLGPIEREGKPAVVIFVTPTIIDPAGNRVHPARKAEQSK